MHRLSVAVFGVMLLAFSSALAYGQFEKPRYDPDSVSALVEQVHTDLNRAYSSWHLSGGDRDRLNHAEKELREFAHKWSNHNFDKGQLDDAISSIQHVLDNNKLPGRERDAISSDVDQLRSMREAYDRHEIG
jgi:hypothetical protein